MAEFRDSHDQLTFLDSSNDVHLSHPTLFTTSRVSSNSSPVLIREVIALVLLVVLSDLTLYRSVGYAGPAVLFVLGPLLLCLGTVRLVGDLSLWILSPMLALLSLRLLWCGSHLAVITGFVLLCCFTMSLAGLRPYLTQVVVFTSKWIEAGYRGLHHYFRTLSRLSPVVLRTQSFSIALPILTFVVFSSIFVMANPHLVRSLGRKFSRLVVNLDLWMQQLHFSEVLFCLVATWLAVGMLRPAVRQFELSDREPYQKQQITKSPYYEPYRNSLVVVIGLFTLYLIFEFQTLWFRTFPPGFHYSGYAHEGAIWLTIALGLATIMLSLIFRGTILRDPRLARLKTLSWVWSLQNMILAMAVFNRLFIYIGFNGMTRMRVIGILGAASVVCGFLLVLQKIARGHSFTWLIRRQLWTVSVAIYLYAVLPVDAFVNQYNVNRVLEGDLRPSVQISAHPTSDEGLLCLRSLTDLPNDFIREGIRAMLTERWIELSEKSPVPAPRHWTAKQFASDRLKKQLSRIAPRWQNSSEVAETDESSHLRRRSKIEEFRVYAYQWY
ncbi:DUF4153 domain-containing protein [Schlesneria sp.]|uniref:DUF4153 domain-containing protein n=1 Tax=Schlesneria sp. TaxID=2762018 RepID=UPI002F19652D